MIGTDFVIDSEGFCFLCRHQIAKAESPSIHSLHNLAQHLKLDMSKVFSEDGPIPQQLLDSVKKSKLKVELCMDCSSLVGKFSKLFRRLEKTEMEVECCLDLIHGKLVRSGGTEQKLMDCNFQNRRLMNKMDIVNALRLDALQKCSLKLRCSRPRIKTQNLSRQQVNAKRRTLKTKSKANMRTENVINSTNTRAETVADGDNLSDNGIGISNDIEFGSNFSDGETDHLYKAEDSQHNMSNDGGVEVDHIKMEHTLEPESTPVITFRSSNAKKQNSGVGKLSESIPDPIKLIGNVGTPQCSIDPVTGKYKCQLCPKEYTTKDIFRRHFKIVHLNVKHKCGVCGNCFVERAAYNQHYLSSHMGVRFGCSECSKVFTDKSTLRRHRESVHLGKRFQCSLCSKSFTQTRPMRLHMKKSCPFRSTAYI